MKSIRLTKWGLSSRRHIGRRREESGSDETSRAIEAKRAAAVS